MICVRGKVLKVKGRELALFFPVRWRDGGATEKVVAGGEGVCVLGGNEEHKFYTGRLPLELQPFTLSDIPF